MRSLTSCFVPGLSTAFVLLLGVLCPPSARGDQVIVDADTTYTAYEVRSPGAATIMARRRLVQTLGLSFARTVGDPDASVTPSLRASVRLRLDQDFGDTCLVSRDLCLRATESGDPGAYQPLAEDTLVDVPAAWVELRDLPFGGQVRLGRQLHFGILDIVRVDGASARVAPVSWFAVDGYFGALARRTSLASAGAFEPQGAIRLDLPDDELARIPFVAPPTTTWVVGGSVEIGDSRYVRARIGYREASEDEGVVARYLSAAVGSIPTSSLRLSMDGVWDVAMAQLVDGVFAVDLDMGRALSFRASAEHHVPRFDLGTIWAYFDLVPVTEAALSASFHPSRTLSISTGIRGRRASFSEGDAEQDLGAEAHGQLRMGGFTLGASAFAWGGDLGPVAAVTLRVARHLTSYALLDARASVWHFDDPSKAERYGASVSEAAGLRLILSQPTTLRFELEHAHSRIVGHRFRFLTALSVEVWR